MQHVSKILLASIVIMSSSSILANTRLSPPKQDTKVAVTFINDTQIEARSVDAFDISHDKFMNIPDLKPGASTTVNFTIPPGGPKSTYPTPGALMGVDWSRDYPQHGSAGAVIVSSQFNVLTVSPPGANYQVDAVKYPHPLETVTIHIKKLP